MIALASLLALAPAVLAMPSLSERTGPTGTVVPSVQCANGKTYYTRGCFDELKSGLTALNHDITSTITTMTVENCVKGCAAANYIIAGLINGNQCRCDNAMSALAPSLDAEQCDLSCSGNADQVCGGTWHYEIYTTTPNAAIPAPSAPPSVGSGDGTYTSIGCYQDDTSNRTLVGDFSNSDTNTPAACVATCYSKGFRLAGVEWGRECYCGNDFVNPNLLDISKCTQACSGDSTQTCGGEGVINVYSKNVDAPETPTQPPAPATTCGNNQHERYVHQGCYTDNTRQRTLNSYSFTSDNMTPTTCSTKCFQKGYKYAGLENGNTCYCGNNCPRSQAPLSHCNKRCGGDRKHAGGGGSGKLTIYKSYTLGWSWNFWPSRQGFW